jgi:hypothetical protein
MRANLTDLTVVIDRSGSMQSCKTDAEGGMNSFIKAQKELPGDCNFSLVQFDTEYEFLYRAKPIRDVTLAYSLVPRGHTALLDAVGRAIVETGERLKNMNEAERPGLVVFVIITDGQENASKEFKRSKIKEMIEHQTNVYKWQFTFLGANQDAFAEAGAMGIPTAGIANYSEQKTSGGILAASGNVTRMRSMALTGKQVVNAYTDEEREAVK